MYSIVMTFYGLKARKTKKDTEDFFFGVFSVTLQLRHCERTLRSNLGRALRLRSGQALRLLRRAKTTQTLLAMTAEQLPYVTTLTAYFSAGTSGRTNLVMSTGFEALVFKLLDRVVHELDEILAVVGSRARVLLRKLIVVRRLL